MQAHDRRAHFRLEIDCGHQATQTYGNQLPRQIMDHEFAIKVSHRDAEIAVRRFIFRNAGRGSWIALILCLGFVGYDLSSGGLGYLGVVMIALIALFVLMCATGYVTRKRQMERLLKKLGDHPVSYRLSESEISTDSPLGRSSLKWEMVRTLWVDPDVTLVFFDRSGYTTIPTPQIPANSLDFMVERIRRAGGSILDNQTKA